MKIMSCSSVHQGKFKKGTGHSDWSLISLFHTHNGKIFITTYMSVKIEALESIAIKLILSK